MNIRINFLHTACQHKAPHFLHRYVQSFIHTIVGSEDLRWWLGLHAHVSDGGGVSWEWESGNDVTYDNWAKSNPGTSTIK